MIKKLIENRENPLSQSGTQWLSGPEVCKILRISTRTLVNYRRRGTLPYAKIGRKIYYKLEDVEQLLERHYVKPAYWKGDVA